MVVQLNQPRESVEVYFHSQQPYVHVTDDDLSQYDAGRLLFPNTYFDPHKAHALYNEYHEQYALADEVGIDGPMPHKNVMRSIELLGKEVVPALHEIKLQPYE